MRNLKKLFAVVMVVAMIASIMVPALAAEYNDDAAALQDLGLFQGYGNGDLGLDDDLTREQGLALMLRVMGLDEDVKAMTEEEIATELARVVDPETITATWARPYVAYAVKNGLTNGIDASILPNVKFAGQLQMNGQEFINFMLNGMGYRTAWNDVLAKAAEVGMLSAGEAVSFGTIAVMRRDDAVGIMSNALTGTTSEGITLAEALVEAGAVDEDKMIEYGYITPTVEPTEAPVEFAAEATVTNLAQINVEFNRDVDKDSAEDTGNYEIDDVEIADATLQDDGVTVVLTLDFDDVAKEIEQQYVTDLVIDGVKDLDDNEMDDYTIEDIEFIDTEIPTAIDAAVVGCDTIKVTFSEPMKSNNDENELKKADFSVNGGKSYVKEVRLQNNNTEAMVELYNDLKEGEITLQVKSGSEDFAGFGVIGKLFTLEVVPDEEAPVVIGYEKASRSEVTLIWNEDIEQNCKDTEIEESFYHTNAKNTVRDPEKLEEDEYSVKFDGNKTTLYFDDDSLLPNGTAYVYVLKEAVRDLWDNENTQQMIQVEVEIDETAPEVDKIEVKAEDKIEIKFTEDLDKDSAEEEDNYTILDDEGDEIKNIIDKIKYSSKKVTMTFEEDLSGDYSIVIEDVEDKAGNKIADVTVDFNVGDKTAPESEDFKATLYDGNVENQMIRVDFDDVMETEGKYSVVDVENYVLTEPKKDGKVLKKLEDIDDVEIEIVDDGKAVEIYIPSKVDADDDDAKEADGDYYNLLTTIKDGEDKDILVIRAWLRIARVADAAGNKMDSMTQDIEVTMSDEIGIDKAEATARDIIEITFKDELADFDEDDILITVDGTDYNDDMIAGVDTKLKDGNTVAVFTLDDDHLLKPSFDDEDYVVTVEVINQESENRYGKKLALGSKDVDDKIKPELFDDGKDTHYAAGKVGYYAEGITDEEKAFLSGRFVKDYFALGAKDDLDKTVSDDVYYFKASLYFNEAIKVKDGVSDALAGGDFVVKIDGGDALVNGTDYFVEIGVQDTDAGAYELIFYFKADKVENDDGDVIGYELEGDLEIELVAKPNYIVDCSGKDNKLAEFDTIELDDMEFSTVPVPAED